MISPDAKAIVGTLRDLRFDWIADEIEEVIRSGKTSAKKDIEPTSRHAKQDLATTSYSETEEQLICLRTLEAYFIELSQVWEKTNQIFGELLTPKDSFEPVVVKIVDEDGQPIIPFESKHMSERDSLGNQLSMAIGSLQAAYYQEQ